MCRLSLDAVPQCGDALPRRIMLGKQRVPAPLRRRRPRPAPRYSGVGFTSPGATSRIMTSIRVSNFAPRQHLPEPKIPLGQLFKRHFEARIEANMPGQLKHVDREFEIDQPARPELDVERPVRRLVTLHLGAHLRRVGRDLREVARHPQDVVDHRRRLRRGLRPSRTPAARGTAPYAPRSRPPRAGSARTRSSETASMPLAPSGRSRVSTS